MHLVCVSNMKLRASIVNSRENTLHFQYNVHGGEIKLESIQIKTKYLSLIKLKVVHGDCVNIHLYNKHVEYKVVLCIHTGSTSDSTDSITTLVPIT